MNRTIVSFCVAGFLAGLSSCASTKDVATVDSLDGEWDIIEIDGTAVVPAPGQPFPFIAFDVHNGKVSGNAGCNRIMGSFDTDAKPGAIDLGTLGATRMMCPDMVVERNVLAALSKVKKYRKLDDENLALCSSSRRPVAVLQRKKPVALADLAGRWAIREVNGEALPDSMENRPYLEFDTVGKRVHGNAGCNVVNGAFQTDETQPASISFPQLITTMMACPDMEIERRLLDALDGVRLFDKAGDTVLNLCGADRTVLVVLVKE